MQAYINPEMLKAPSDQYWDDRTIMAWGNGAQNAILQILIELHLENDDSAFNLGKNLWKCGANEDKIREQLTLYATSKPN